MSLDLRGYRKPRGGATTFREDKRGLGLLSQRLLVPGPGSRGGRAPLRTQVPALDFAAFSQWADLDVGTVLSATIGGYWRWTGAAWIPDGRFFLQPLVQGPVATGAASVSNPAAGFNGFGPALEIPFPFWTVGRRLRITGTITCASAAATAHTRLMVGTVVVFDAQWSSTYKAQTFEIDLWVSDTTQITVSARVIYSVVTPPESIVTQAADYAVAGLNTTEQDLSFGIYDAGGSSGLYKLLDFPVEVVA